MVKAWIDREWAAVSKGGKVPRPNVYLTEEDSLILIALADARPKLLTQEQIEGADTS